MRRDEGGRCACVCGGGHAVGMGSVASVPLVRPFVWSYVPAVSHACCFAHTGHKVREQPTQQRVDRSGQVHESADDERRQHVTSRLRSRLPLREHPRQLPIPLLLCLCLYCCSSALLVRLLRTLPTLSGARLEVIPLASTVPTSCPFPSSCSSSPASTCFSRFSLASSLSRSSSAPSSNAQNACDRNGTTGRRQR